MQTCKQLTVALLMGACALAVYQDAVWACLPPPPVIVETSFSGEFPPCLDTVRTDDFKGFLLPLRFGSGESRCDVNVILRASWDDSSLLIGVSKTGELFDLREMAPLMASEHPYLVRYPSSGSYSLLRLSQLREELSHDTEHTTFFEWTITDSDAKDLEERFAVASPKSSWSRYDMLAKWGYGDSAIDEYNCEEWAGEGFDEDMGAADMPSMDDISDEPSPEQDMTMTRQDKDGEPSYEYGGCSVSASKEERGALPVLLGMLLFAVGSRRRNRHGVSHTPMSQHGERG